MEVALFVTCLTEHHQPRAAVATVRLLEALGCRVTFPAAQTCCGQPMFNNGLEDEARRLGGRLLAVFGDAGPVVTPSGSCAAMVRTNLPELFRPGSPDHAAARRLAARTHEIGGFVLDVLGVDVAGLGARHRASVAYHPACHLRLLERFDGGERLLGGIADLDLRPLERREQCCGFGGTFASSFPEVSGAMVRDKVGCLRATGADTVACGDCGCTMNLAGACRRAGWHPRFVHPAELLAEALDLLPVEDTGW